MAAQWENVEGGHVLALVRHYGPSLGYRFQLQVDQYLVRKEEK